MDELQSPLEHRFCHSLSIEQISLKSEHVLLTLDKSLPQTERRKFVINSGGKSKIFIAESEVIIGY